MAYPCKVRALILRSALASRQQSCNTILRITKAIYAQRNDTINLHELATIHWLDTTSLAYRTLVFKHASANGFFTLRLRKQETCVAVIRVFFYTIFSLLAHGRK